MVSPPSAGKFLHRARFRGGYGCTPQLGRCLRALLELLVLLDGKSAPNDFCCHFPSARKNGARGSGLTGNRPTVIMTSPWALIVQSAGAKLSRPAALQEVPGRDRP